MSLAPNFYYTCNFNPQWYAKFTELITKLHQSSKVLNLQSDSVIVPKELRQILPPPLSGVKHLSFSISIPFKNFAAAQVVDVASCRHDDYRLLDVPSRSSIFRSYTRMRLLVEEDEKLLNAAQRKFKLRL